MVCYSVIIPTYNERENVAPLIWMVQKAFATLQAHWEVVVVDDSSPDGTAEVVRSMQNLFSPGQLVLVERAGKLGLGTAYKEGLARSTGDFVVFMDADFSHHPRHLEEFVSKQLATRCDIVTGTRYKEGGGVSGWSFKRKLISRGANVLAATLLQPGQVSDLTGAYRLYRRACLEKVMPLVTSKGYAFQMEIIVRAHYMGYQIEEVPIVFVDRLFGDSKLGKEEMVLYAKGLIRLLFTL